MTEMVLLDDERIGAVPVEDGGEPLVDLRTVCWLDVDGRQADAAGLYARVRTGVLGRLRSRGTPCPPAIGS
ncbi:hypothetical protein ACWD4G_40060 [Streptomyces sp. NPDC002643]